MPKPAILIESRTSGYTTDKSTRQIVKAYAKRHGISQSEALRKLISSTIFARRKLHLNEVLTEE